MIEEYRPINGYENYLVSNFGTVINTKTETALVPELGKFGHLKVSLYKNGVKKHFWIHRLVAQAFIPNPDNLDTVDHIDGNPNNNKVNNLQWLSQSDNSKRFWEEQATEEWKRKSLLSLQNGRIIAKELKSWKKANEAKKKPVICTDTNTIYQSVTQASKKLNITSSQIGRTALGELKQTHGLHFKYL